ncbi:Transcriptional activator of proteases prtT [Penicillium canariense]|uniref:Transcriptional activator of proteases prtT n=1 Tax=Penicillium canariense TaxID=189055 RepID=A0A9W9I928_9EURO|nr:Transcriptional activator of proteases prtT [Penicillium canariense]KAJ5168961.1 Transcriptional activator of proteases prtT [Penicillium canariense]
MTRTGPAISTTSWETKSIAATDDGHRMDSVGHDPRPRGRIRRSMTACNTCRKLKTRCDVDPRGHACRRCLSLRVPSPAYRPRPRPRPRPTIHHGDLQADPMLIRLDCELPETQDRFQDNASTWSDANMTIPSIEERLVSLERGMGEMIHLMRQMVNQPSTISDSPHSQAGRSVDEAHLDKWSPSFTLKPVQFIRDLQIEYFRDQFSSEADLLGDVVSQGIIDAKLSLKLIELFGEYYSPWVSLDLSSSIQRSDTLLFNTACLLASRYLPGMPANTIHEISLQVQHGVTKTLWRRSPLTIDLLQALALLCLYPTSGHKEGFMDGWLLSGISINHALISFRLFNNLPNKNVVTDETLCQMRLWNTFCLTHLHSALGYGRAVNVQQHHLDYCAWILEHPRATSEDGRIVAEIKLYRIALKIQSNLQRLRFAEGDTWFCQLLLHRTAARLQPDSDKLVPEICSDARLIISRSLQTRFSAAPGLIDNVYYILGYAALTLCDYNPSDPQIDQVRAFLLHLAPSSDHLAYRIACIVGEVQRRYSEAASADHASPGADVLKNSIFAVPSHPRTESIDLTQLIPASGMEPLVDGYACFDQLIPTGYVPAQPAFSAPTMFQQHPTPVLGGAMPSLVPRALHDL